MPSPFPGIPLVIEEPARQTYIEILRRPDRNLVAVLELLSPANKTPPGLGEYLAKRNAILRQEVHLLELDLLLQGERMTLRDPLPAGDYYALVARADHRPNCDVYAWTLRDGLPTIPIPLRPPDADLQIDLAAVMRTTYDRGRYAKSVDYNAAPEAIRSSPHRSWVLQQSAAGSEGVEADPKKKAQDFRAVSVNDTQPRKATLQGGTFDRSHAQRIIENAVRATQTRWLAYGLSWRELDVAFIERGYEQQGFKVFHFAPYLEKRGLLCIEALGSIVEDGQRPAGYNNAYAKGVNAPFYQKLRLGEFGENGRQFADATREFNLQEPTNCGRFYWKLLWQMLQACAYLRRSHRSSFAKYVVSAFGQFAQRAELSEAEFLAIPQAEWLAFLKAARPWTPLAGIGENVFDFIIGDIVEARFARDSFKLDSANEYFLKVTGIASLIDSLERDSVIEFMRSLELPYSLREINKGIYT